MAIYNHDYQENYLYTDFLTYNKRIWCKTCMATIGEHECDNCDRCLTGEYEPEEK